MDQHKRLLESNASLAEYEAAREARLLAEAKFYSLERDENARKRAFIATWLAATDVRSDQDRGRLVRENHTESGKWLFFKDRFRTWFDHRSYSTPFLWIHGKPGSGNIFAVECQ